MKAGNPWRPAALALASVALLAGCSSPQDDIDEACSQVGAVTNAVPATAGDDTGREVVPRLDEQLTVAKQARGPFAEAGAASGFRKAWQNMIGALEENRTAWKASMNPNRPPGSDLYFVMNLGDKEKAAKAADRALEAAAVKAGYRGCGATLHWKY